MRRAQRPRRHDDAASGIDLRSAAGVQIRSDGEDLFALDKHVGLREIADFRVERHHRAATNDIAPPRPATVGWRVVSRGGARREQVQPRSRDPGRRRTFQKIAP